MPSATITNRPLALTSTSSEGSTYALQSSLISRWQPTSLWTLAVIASVAPGALISEPASGSTWILLDFFFQNLNISSSVFGDRRNRLSLRGKMAGGLQIPARPRLRAIPEPLDWMYE